MSEAKWAWWLAVVYTLGAILVFIPQVPNLDFSSRAWSLLLQVIYLHMCLFILFYLAYWAQNRIFAALSACWFGYCTVLLGGKILMNLPYYQGDSFWFWLAGASTGFTFVSLMLYLSIQVTFKPKPSS